MTKRSNPNQINDYSSKSWTIYGLAEVNSLGHPKFAPFDGRTVNYTDPETGLTSETIFKSDPTRRFIELTNPIAAYNLNDVEIRSDMFRSFLRVHDESSALAWAKRFGCPWEENENALIRSMVKIREELLAKLAGENDSNASPIESESAISVDSFLKAAATVRWLWKMHQAVKREDIEKLLEWMKTKRDFVQLAQVIRKKNGEGEIDLMDPRQFSLFHLAAFTSGFPTYPWLPAKAREGMTPAQLREWEIEETRELQRERGVTHERDTQFVTFAPSEIQDWEGMYWFSHKFHFLPHRNLLVDCDEADQLGTDSRVLVRLAKSYLKATCDQLLIGVHPSMEWRQYRNDVRLVPILKVSSPLHAIALILFQHISGALASKKCATCQEIITPTRRDQRFCDKPGCRKAASRARKRERSRT